jgi:hypothetical protein
LLLWAEELSRAHGEGGVGSSSWTDEALLRPNLNPFSPSVLFAGSSAGFSLFPSCFLLKRPMVTIHKTIYDLKCYELKLINKTSRDGKTGTFSEE